MGGVSRNQDAAPAVSRWLPRGLGETEDRCRRVGIVSKHRGRAHRGGKCKHASR